MRSYVVQPGDTPASIAAILAGCPKCARDLVKSNPHKHAVMMPNGFMTFADWHAGEEINLPEKWFSKHFDELPEAYFKALPSADGVTPSSLGSAAAGILGDYSTLDTAITKIDSLPGLSDAEFADTAVQAAAALADSVRDVSPPSGAAQDAQAAAIDAHARIQQLEAALQAGDPNVPSSRSMIQSVLAAGIDRARVALKDFYTSVPATTTVPGAVQALASLDPCSASSAAAVCAAQTVLGVIPDGKYGDSTAAIAKKIAPGSPPACNPRPAWWSPPGGKNCPGASTTPPATKPPVTNPVPAPATTPIASTPPKGMSFGSVVGLGLAGAGIVGLAIHYIALKDHK